MRNNKKATLAIIINLFICLICPIRTGAENFVIPYDGTLFLKPMGGEAGATTEFGLGTSLNNFSRVFTNLPDNPSPNDELLVGDYLAGDIVYFGMFTEFLGETDWAFSCDTISPASITAFTDKDNSLGFGGRVIEQISSETWLMHLDDAMSYKFDDDDNDILMQIRHIPEPSAMSLFGLGTLALLRKRKE